MIQRIVVVLAAVSFGWLVRSLVAREEAKAHRISVTPPWQRVTFIQGDTAQSVFIRCTERHDEVFVWPGDAGWSSIEVGNL